jgi:hypothetical protein
MIFRYSYLLLGLFFLGSLNSPSEILKKIFFPAVRKSPTSYSLCSPEIYISATYLYLYQFVTIVFFRIYMLQRQRNYAIQFAEATHSCLLIADRQRNSYSSKYTLCTRCEMPVMIS